MCPFGVTHKVSGKGFCTVGRSHVTVSCQSPRCGRGVRLEGDAFKDARRVLREAAGMGHTAAAVSVAAGETDEPDEPDDRYAALKFLQACGEGNIRQET